MKIHADWNWDHTMYILSPQWTEAFSNIIIQWHLCNPYETKTWGYVFLEFNSMCLGGLQSIGMCIYSNIMFWGCVGMTSRLLLWPNVSAQLSASWEDGRPACTAPCEMGPMALWREAPNISKGQYLLIFTLCVKFSLWNTGLPSTE